ncbi:MAG: tetratricopeptide repeat protein, partial [Candidatus Eisenbacteria bacterium]|nr:tetratricopeptide repeat protein [Candidatus Eisenbacteria bacterium]
MLKRFDAQTMMSVVAVLAVVCLPAFVAADDGERSPGKDRSPGVQVSPGDKPSSGEVQEQSPDPRQTPPIRRPRHLPRRIESSPQRALEMRLRQARLHQSRGEADVALEILRELQEQHPHDIRVVRGLGDALESLGRFDEAVRLYEGEIAAERHASHYLLDLAGAWRQMGRPQKVLETVFRYLEAHPTRHRWAQDMIESLSRRGELGDEEI